MDLKVEWQGKMAFSGITPSGHELITDASEAAGGENRGVRPMELLLGAVVGCTGIDILSILGKMRIEPTAFTMEANGERVESHPKRFTRIHIHYALDGELPEDKVFRAIELSLNKYCSVAYSLNADIIGSYSINGGERMNLELETGGK